MRTPPADLSGAEVADAVAAGWSVVAASIEHAPVGFGSHHWVLTEPDGRRWFVTADAVADSPRGLAQLTSALTTAHALRHDCGLSFVVSPQIGVDGQVLAVTGPYAVALYPYLERTTDAPADSEQQLSMVIALHAATADVGTLAAVDDLAIPDRPALESLLAVGNPAPEQGPYAADFDALVRSHERPIRAALHRHDAVASTLTADRSTWVVTHGELKADNTMVTAGGPVLVDWDTVRLAPPARDLWMTGSVEEYVSRTGREVPAEELDFYRLRWDLADLCSFAAWFTEPHERNPDTEVAWQASVAICRHLDDSAQ